MVQHQLDVLGEHLFVASVIVDQQGEELIRNVQMLVVVGSALFEILYVGEDIGVHLLVPHHFL